MTPTAIRMSAALLLLLAAGAAAQAATPAELERGKALFDRWCTGCHLGKNRMGEQPAGTYALDQRYKGARPAEITQRTDLQPAFIKSTVRVGINAMPKTRRTELGDADLDLVIAWMASVPKLAAP